MSEWLPDGSKIFVYEMPDALAHGYCFDGGHPVAFKCVDWFDGFGGITTEDVQREIETKEYFRLGVRYLVVHTRHELTFSFCKIEEEQP